MIDCINKLRAGAFGAPRARAILGLLLLSCSLLMSVTARPAHAGTFVVGAPDDPNITSGVTCPSGSSGCALRDALYAARENPDEDTLVFNNSVDVMNIVKELPTIITNMTIQGRGATLRATSNFRLLRVESTGSLKVSGINFENARTPGFGAAINNNGTLNVSSCAFEGNSAGGSGGASTGGGAISNFHGTVTVSQSYFDNNSARAYGSQGESGLGGAILSDGGSLSISNCLFENNSAVAYNRGSGGAVAMRSGTLIISDSEFRSNMSKNAGGAVYSTGANATLSNVTFASNSVTNGQDPNDARGGGFFFSSLNDEDGSTGVSYVGNGTFVGNRAASGGAVFHSSSTANILRLDSCTLAGNSATQRGGGVEFTSGAGTIVNSILAGNSAPTSPNVYGSFAPGVGPNLLVASAAEAGLQTDSSGAPLLKDNSGPVVGVRVAGQPADYRQRQMHTVALRLLSPALNGGNTSASQDARGYPRPQFGADDIGAFEFQSDDVAYSDNTTKSFIVTTLSDVSALGQTTLRDAIIMANYKNGDDTISFAPGLSGTIALDKALPDLTNVSINGPGASVITVRPKPGTSFGIFGVPTTVTVAVSNLTLAGGLAINGGALLNFGNSTLTRCTLTSNTATSEGGAIYNGGTLKLDGCTLSSNTAQRGGGVHSSGTLTLSTTQLSSNTATRSGGGLFNEGTLTMVASLFNSNTASGSGSGIGGGGWFDWTKAAISATNCTFSGNSTQGSGGGIYLYDQSGGLNTGITLDSLTVTRNSGNVGGLLNDAARTGSALTFRNCVIAGSTSNGAAGLSYVGDAAGSNNFVSGDPKLDPLQNNGGPLPTHGFLTDSPLFNAGNTGLTTDARGIARPQFKFKDIGAFEYDAVQSPSLVVTTLTDEDNGTSDPAFGTGTSLREAIDRAQADGVDSVITFSPTVFAARQTIALSSELVLAPNGKLAIQGPSAGVTVSGSSGVRIFTIQAGANVDLSNIRLTAGRNWEGGAIYNSGTLRLSNAVIDGNYAENRGGGIYNVASATLLNVTVANNSTQTGNYLTRGGGFYNTGSLTLVNCTIANNVTSQLSGAIHNTGSVAMRNTLLAHNNWDNSDLVGVTPPPSTGDANGNFRFASLAQAGLGELADNGGAVLTMALVGRAPVVNKGVDTTQSPYNLVTDARGGNFTRNAGGAVDAGAFELQNVLEPLSLVVTTTKDVVDDYDYVTSLREAVAYANTDNLNSAITFDPNVFATRQTITLNSALTFLPDGTDVLRSTTVTAPSAGVTLSGGGKNRIIDVGKGYFQTFYVGARVTLQGFTLTDGYAPSEAGAIHNLGTLVLTGVTVMNSRSDTGAGAISNLSASLTLNNSTVAGNSSSNGKAGGIYVDGGSFRLNNATVVGNSGPQYGAIYNINLETRNMSIRNSLFVANGPNPFFGFIDPTTSGDVNRNLSFSTLTEAGLGTLADNGGPTPTHALLEGSPAINAADNDTARDNNNQVLLYDQRGAGFPRIQDDRVDVGAFELTYVPPRLSLGNTSVMEGNTGNGSVESGTQFLRMPFFLSEASRRAITFTYRTNNGTATAGSDFIGTSTGSVTIPAGQTTGVILVPILGDKRFETNETMSILLTGASGAIMGSNMIATGVIMNDDQKPTVSINSVSQSEGNSGTSPLIFTVSLTALSDTDTVIPFSTLDSSGASGATAGSDYVGVTSGSITIPANQSSVPLPITINGDSLVEGDESFSVVLGDPTAGNATLSPEKSGVGTILNDESAAPAATPVPSSVTLFKSGFMRNRRTNRLVQTVVIQNNSGAAISGPIYLTVDNLVGGTFYGSTGSTAMTSPVGSPYRTIVLEGNILPTGATLLDLEFVTTNTSVTYGTRLLVGPGTP